LSVVSNSTATFSRACKQVWAYRKAAWAIEDLQDIGLIHRRMGRKDLESIGMLGRGWQRCLRHCSRNWLAPRLTQLDFGCTI